MMNLVNLDSNENLYNPYNQKEFLDVLDIKKELFEYPNDDYYELRKGYAKYVNLEAENVIAGNGSDEMLNLIIANYIFKGDKLMTLGPDFGMYDFYVRQNEGVMHKYIFDKEKFNIAEFINEIKEVNPKVLMFSNPNNPTGMALKRDEVKLILEEFKDIKIVIDEAYYEFFGDSIISEVNNYKNLIVTRTLSKAFGLASIRVGFLISNKEEVKKLRGNKVPFNINRISNKIAICALEKVEFMQVSVNNIIRERDYLYKELKSIESSFKDIKFYKSYANYIYFEGKSVEKIREALLEKGIKIRSFDRERARLTIGTTNENKKMLDIIKTCRRSKG